MTRDMLLLILALALLALTFVVCRRLWLNKRAYWRQVQADMDARHKAERAAFDAWLAAQQTRYWRVENDYSAWRGGSHMSDTALAETDVVWRREHE